ncbi:TonB-dependent receptor [Allorhizobium undicola]|uniref:TonB-dependent receptor n=1 Tax=Allorhizobium undicola TaxID=78527 RepID=UPI00048A3DD6|nr:TonB-dependent receptor [Allorhizobium undicola]
MFRNVKGSLLRSVSVVTLAMLGAMPAFAEDAANKEKETVLDTIVVTGEKVERSLQRTASSVEVLTDKKIKEEKTGDSTVSEATRDVPNVVYTDTVSAPVIRGQDTQGPNTGSIAFLSGTVPRASIDVDGHYLGYYEYVFGASSIWDVSSIEVFRGPQTTSQGANAIAGAIVVNTKDPTFEREAAYQAELGSYGYKRASGVVSGALVEDQLAARLALDYSGRNTFIDYISNSFAKGNSDQDFQEFNARFKLLWEPTEISGLTAKLTYSHNNSNRPSQEAAFAPYDDLDSKATYMPSWRQFTNTWIGDVNYDLENGIKLTNTTQYSDSNVYRISNVQSNGSADILQNTISNESRVTFGDEEDKLSGFIGVYYAHTDSDETLYLTQTSVFKDKKDNLGVFGEASYRLTDDWRLTGGLRLEHDQVQRTGYYATGGSQYAIDYDESFTALLPKVSLSYDINPDWTVGGLINRGYNPGGVSINTSTREWLTFKEETLWNYELFNRAKFLDDRLVLGTNVFYMDMKNAQRYVGVSLGNGLTQYYTVNADEAYAYGLELSAEYEVLDNVRLKASAGAMRTEITKMSSKTEYEGNEFQKSPGFMGTFGASWDITDQITLSGDVRYTDGYYSDDANDARYAVDAYTIANARVSYKLNDKVEFYSYVKNIFDERVPTFMQANRSVGLTEASMTAPRTFGIGIRGSF